MNAEELRRLQQPLKEKYRQDSSAAVVCLLWCIPGFRQNDWVLAFKLLK